MGAIASKPEPPDALKSKEASTLKELEDAMEDTKMKLASLTSMMGNITGSKVLEVPSRKGSRPIASSLTEVSLTGGSRADALATMQGATPCFDKPCVWNPGSSASKSMGYYSFDPGDGNLNACPTGYRREWTTCNNGQMQNDGCRGYCAQDPMPGYVSMMSPKMGDHQDSFAVRLVTKGELDLLREQLDRRWNTMIAALQKTQQATSEQVKQVESSLAGGSQTNSQLFELMEQQRVLRQGMDNALATSLNSLKTKVVNSFHKVEVQNQRAMIAALHGSAGMCCCWYRKADATAQCAWHTFMGDIDQRSTARFLNSGNVEQHLRKNRGAVQDVSFAGPATIRCGTNDDDNLPMLAYSSLFASKSQMESLNVQNERWQNDKNGPSTLKCRSLWISVSHQTIGQSLPKQKAFLKPIGVLKVQVQLSSQHMTLTSQQMDPGKHQRRSL